MKNIIETLSKQFPDTEKETIEVLAGIIEYGNHDFDDDAKFTLRETIENIEHEMGDDFTIEHDGNEYRIIKESAIWEIYRDEIENIVTDCYDLKLDKIPDFIAVSIDWEQTAKNAYADGYGHTFSGYDHGEVCAGSFWVFRTN